MQEKAGNNLEEAIVIAQKAFDELKAVAFWNWKEDTKVTQKNLDLIIQTLRAEGGRKGYYFVHQIQNKLQKSKSSISR
jgi:hypothetical protein